MTCPVTQFTYYKDATPSGGEQPLFYVYGNSGLKRWVGSADKKVWTALSNSSPTQVGKYVVDFSQTPDASQTKSPYACTASTDPGSAAPCVQMDVTPAPKSYPATAPVSLGSYSQLFSCPSEQLCPDASIFGKYCCGTTTDKGPCPGTLVRYGSLPNYVGYCVNFTNSPGTFVVQAMQPSLTTGWQITDGTKKVSFPLKDSSGKDSGRVATFDFTAKPGSAPAEWTLTYSPPVLEPLPAPKKMTTSTFQAANSGDDQWVTQWGAALCCSASSWPPAGASLFGGSDSGSDSGGGSTSGYFTLSNLLIVAGVGILGYWVYNNKSKKK